MQVCQIRQLSANKYKKKSKTSELLQFVRAKDVRNRYAIYKVDAGSYTFEIK